MYKKLVTKLVLWSLSTTRLDGENKTLITSRLLNNLGAIPVMDIVRVDEFNKFIVEGKQLDTETAMQLFESAQAMKNSLANNLIHRQLNYQAIKMGVHEGLNPDMIMFSKAALWYIQEYKKLLTTITGK